MNPTGQDITTDQEIEIEVIGRNKLDEEWHCDELGPETVSTFNSFRVTQCRSQGPNCTRHKQNVIDLMTFVKEVAKIGGPRRNPFVQLRHARSWLDATRGPFT